MQTSELLFVSLEVCLHNMWQAICEHQQWDSGPRQTVLLFCLVINHPRPPSGPQGTALVPCASFSATRAVLSCQSVTERHRRMPITRRHSQDPALPVPLSPGSLNQHWTNPVQGASLARVMGIFDYSPLWCRAKGFVFWFLIPCVTNAQPPWNGKWTPGEEFEEGNLSGTLWVLWVFPDRRAWPSAM